MFGVARVVHACVPLLRRSAADVVINVSSGMGSLAVTTDPSRFESTLNGVAYPSSYPAANIRTSQYAKSYPALWSNAVDPGDTSTEPNGHRSTQTVEQGR